MKELGSLIKRARIRVGYSTQRSFADAWGKDASFVSRVEAGTIKEMLPAPEVERLHHLLGIPIADMVVAAGYRIDPESDEVLSGSDRIAGEVCALAGMVDWDNRRARVVQAIMTVWMDEDRAGLRLVAEEEASYDDAG